MVLPGVTVEASSPALIEKTRSVVTDAAGQYRIVELSPGTYSVTYTLPGFRTITRDGLILEGTFTAQVNIQMQVGAVEENVTVSGIASTVDVVQNTTTHVLNRDDLDSIPTATRNTPDRALLLPGTTVTPFVLGQYNVSVHGSARGDFTIAIDGMRVNNLCGSGQYSGFYMNDASVQELTYNTDSGSAEYAASGLRVNSIPKDGGNTFAGTFFLYGTGGSLQSDNRSDAVKAAGIQDPPGVAYDWQINPGFGGPLMRDKAWFYFTYKYQKAKNYVAGVEFPDGSPAYRELKGNYSGIGRLTLQATQKDKLRVYVEKQFNGEYFNGFNTVANQEVASATDAEGGGWVPQVKWTRTHSNRLLLEAGLSLYRQPYEQTANKLDGPLDVAHLELTTSHVSVGPGYFTPLYSSWTHDYNFVASGSYVTGSHALKIGGTMLWGTNERKFTAPGELNSLLFFSGFPYGVSVSNGPAEALQKVKADLGIYAQDSWTLNRITLNLGVRYDHFNAEVPAESSPASTWIQARDFAAIPNVPNWNDWSTRTFASWDLFGDGKTALKFGAGKYLASQAAGYAANFNGMSYSTQTRLWSDLNHDGTVLNSDGSVQFNEVFGGTSNFGQITSRPDPNLARGYNWEYSASIERELVPRLRVTVGYYRRVFKNLDLTDNVNLDPSDWTPFTITVPNDSRLPNAGDTITMYTLNTNKVGVATDNLRTYSTGQYGPKRNSVYNGIEASVNARLNKAIFFGSFTTDRSTSTTCDEPDNPNNLRFCDSPGAFRTTVKGSVAYNLPYDVQVSGSVHAIPGASISANYTVNAAIAGQPIVGSTSGSTTIAVNLIEPDTMFQAYQTQVDARVAKTFRFGRYRAQGFVDVFNLTNAGAVVRLNTTYGTSWLTPQAILQGRYIRFGTQWTF